MGPWFYSAGDAAIKGKVAYEDAHRQRAMGVSPDDAYRHALDAAVYVTWGKIALFGAWSYTAFLGIICLHTLWAWPLFGSMVVLNLAVSNRLKQWRQDRADTIRVYDFSTKWLVGIWIGWGFTGWLWMVYLRAFLIWLI